MATKATPAMWLGFAAFLLLMLGGLWLMVRTLVGNISALRAMPQDTEKRVHALLDPLLADGQLKVVQQGVLGWTLEGAVARRAVKLDVQRGYRGAAAMTLFLRLALPAGDAAQTERRAAAARQRLSAVAPHAAVKVSGDQLFIELPRLDQVADLPGLLRDLVADTQ